MIYFGIDPGKSGAIAAIWDDGAPYICCCKGSATYKDLSDYLHRFDTFQARAVIEKVHSSPQMGVKSAFTFGQSYGFLLGLLTSHEIPYVEVSPQKWQGYMGCKTGGNKNITKHKAQQLWPHLKITHANADALLIAEYGRQTWRNL